MARKFRKMTVEEKIALGKPIGAPYYVEVKPTAATVVSTTTTTQQIYPDPDEEIIEL